MRRKAAARVSTAFAAVIAGVIEAGALYAGYDAWFSFGDAVAAVGWWFIFSMQAAAWFLFIWFWGPQVLETRP